MSELSTMICIFLGSFFLILAIIQNTAADDDDLQEEYLKEWKDKQDEKIQKKK